MQRSELIIILGIFIIILYFFNYSFINDIFDKSNNVIKHNKLLTKKFIQTEEVNKYLQHRLDSIENITDTIDKTDINKGLLDSLQNIKKTKKTLKWDYEVALGELEFSRRLIFDNEEVIISLQRQLTDTVLKIKKLRRNNNYITNDIKNLTVRHDSISAKLEVLKRKNMRLEQTIGVLNKKTNN